mgnify:FL=1|jgi:hypothetical protein|tara:strand:- start:666 stop:842 length:177 start_codon:yes stop_codon:yes gene_type:complete
MINLLSQYHAGDLELWELLYEGTTLHSIKTVCSYLTDEGQKEFEGYHFDDLIDYYQSI